MIYLAAGVYFFAGLALGYIIGVINDTINQLSEQHSRALEESRKSLETLLVQSRIADEILERKNEEDL